MSTWSITERGRTPRQQVAALAVLAVVPALLAAGCGSAGPTTTTTGSATAGTGGPAAAAFQYARCMRQHGVTSFPDPHVTSTPGSGSVRISQMAPASAGNSPAFKSAAKACQGILATPQNAGPSPGQPNKQDLLAFAHCLRSHGISGFPDPNAQGRLTGQMIAAAGIDYRSRTFETAGDACVGVTHGAITRAEVHALVSGAH
jgi:hypothetical protein